MTEEPLRHVLVAGMGISGISAARLALNSGSYTVDACDRLPEESLPAAVKDLVRAGMVLHAAEEGPSLLGGVDTLVLSPGVPMGSELVTEALRNGIEVVGEIEWGYRHSRGRVIAVTGSNGKSTTTSLLGELLSGGFSDVRTGGNLGTPFCDMVEGSTEKTWFVLEVSSFQLESVRSFRPHVALLLNITPDHQDRYETFELYQEAKGRIFKNQGFSDFAIFSAADPHAARFGREAQSVQIPFSTAGKLQAGVFLRGQEAVWVRDEEEEILFSLSDLPLPGVHNIENAMAACTAARCAGVDGGAIAEKLRTFRGLPHRLEFVSERGGVRAFNDSKATNTDSVAKALSAFQSGVLLLLGGKDKGADWISLIPEVKRCCSKVVAFGAAREKVARAFSGVVDLESFASLKDATAHALGSATAGQTVLLSPACASFDEFKNFEERGDLFRSWVLRWSEEGEK